MMLFSQSDPIDRFIHERLEALSDSDYKAFNQRIIPTAYEMKGVRLPALRGLAKEIAANAEVGSYLDHPQYDCYEQVLLYGLVLAQVKQLSPNDTFRYLDPLILRFDSWAHVDTVTPAFKSFRKYPDEVLQHYLPLKTHEGEFTKRFFVILLMDYYLDEEHIDDTLQHLAQVPQGQYYVDMGIAWALSVGLVKFYGRTLSWLERKAFSSFVHNKAIQKARESYRISPEVKERLKRMKV